MRVSLLVISCLIGGGLLLSACWNQETHRTSVTQYSEEAGTVDSTQIPIDKAAVCVWSVAGLREEPGRKERTKDGKNNYLVSVYYGEVIEMIDTPAVEISAENRVYMMVRLKDGQQGWVHEYLFEKNARLAAFTQEAEIYRRPDQMTLKDEKFEPGEIVASMERIGDWLHVSGREKKKKGWIKVGNNLTMAKKDLKVALLYYMAMEENTLAGRRQKLESIITDKALVGSVLMDLIEQALQEAESTSATSVRGLSKPFPVPDEADNALVIGD